MRIDSIKQPKTAKGMTFGAFDISKLLILILFFILFNYFTAIAGSDNSQIDSLMNEHYHFYFKNAAIFNIALFLNTDKATGLKQEKLLDYTKLRFLNNFAGFRLFDNFQEDSIAGKGIKELPDDSVGIIFINVWTVGKDYPIAFHVSLKAGTLDKLDVYDDAYLGYSSAKCVENQIKESINTLMETFAVIFFKARDRL